MVLDHAFLDQDVTLTMPPAVIIACSFSLTPGVHMTWPSTTPSGMLLFCPFWSGNAHFYGQMGPLGVRSIGQSISLLALTFSWVTICPVLKANTMGPDVKKKTSEVHPTQHCNRHWASIMCQMLLLRQRDEDLTDSENYSVLYDRVNNRNKFQVL